jgi:hypothetical protein
MRRIKGEYWNIEDNLYRLQLKTTAELEVIEEMLPGWECVSFGYVPTTKEDILVFEKNFESKFDWTNFISSDNITTENIDLREA